MKKPFFSISHLINAEFFLPLQEKRANNRTGYDDIYPYPADRSLWDPR